MTIPLADRKALVVLSGLPKVGPSRLRALLGDAPAAEVLARLRRRRTPITAQLEQACAGASPSTLVESWSAAADGVDEEARWREHQAAGVAVLAPGDDRWPFTDDPEPPSVLFCLGDLGLLGPERRRVGIVGTRRCTAYGAEVATTLGGDLAGAGVSVVSGMANGIDGAAHVGVLRRLDDLGDGPGEGDVAPPIGVTATGLDVVYPRNHRRLWRLVSQRGLLLAEVPLGTPPTRWRFPARNRLIAGLSAVVVVVESAERGGSMHTVDDALRRDVPVLAVPGPVTSAASAGTNRLLADGAAPAAGLHDVLDAAGFSPPRRRRRPSAPAPEPSPDGEAGQVLDALGWTPSTLDQVLLRSGLDLGRATVLVHELEAGGWLRSDGGWLERCR